MSAPPSAENCFEPRSVLKSLQELERDVRRYDKDLPARWEFSWRDAQGERVRAESVLVVHEGRNCRLFGDHYGVWAVETDPGPREGIHHKLGRPLELGLQLAGREGEVVVGIRRISRLDDAAKELAAFKQLCIRAMEQKAVLFTSAG